MAFILRFKKLCNPLCGPMPAYRILIAFERLFTDPIPKKHDQAGRKGLRPFTAKPAEQGLKFRRKSKNVPEWCTARRIKGAVYGYKTLVDEESGRTLGVHLAGRMSMR